MAIQQTQNPQINLKTDNNESDDSNISRKEDKSLHRKEFEERLKKIDEKESGKSTQESESQNVLSQKTSEEPEQKVSEEIFNPENVNTPESIPKATDTPSSNAEPASFDLPTEPMSEITEETKTEESRNEPKEVLNKNITAPTISNNPDEIFDPTLIEKTDDIFNPDTFGGLKTEGNLEADMTDDAILGIKGKKQKKNRSLRDSILSLFKKPKLNTEVPYMKEPGEKKSTTIANIEIIPEEKQEEKIEINKKTVPIRVKTKRTENAAETIIVTEKKQTKKPMTPEPEAITIPIQKKDMTDEILEEALKPIENTKTESQEEVKETTMEIKKGKTAETTTTEKPGIIERITQSGETYHFPEDFLWGTATSAYQIEGENINNWSEWERSASRLKHIMHKGGKSIDYICNQACDSYNRYAEDLDLVVSLKNNAIRFGLEWSRIEPEKGGWDIKTVNHYRAVLAAAKERGLKTIITLWHWTLPVWVAKKGGWTNKLTIEYFKEFVDLVIKEFGANIDYWITLNEPMVPIGFGYITGKHPPGKKFAILKAYKIFSNLVEAHKESYKQIHNHFPNSLVGISSLTDYFEPLIKFSPLDQILTIIARYLHHGAFLKNIKKHLDFVGLNYYFHNRISFIPPFKFNKNKNTSDMGWEIYPEGIYHVLKELEKFNKPIIITENGVADASDGQRPEFIKSHLYWIHRAIQDGIDVQGYMHWSLLDNFEWAWGYGPKFGLYSVDRNTFERKPRPSVEVYKDICVNNRIII